MNCYFCKEYITAFKKSYTFKFCKCCNVEYYKYHANMRLKGSIPGDYQDAKPYIQFRLIPQPSAAVLVFKAEYLVTWKYMPNITPQNLDEKIKLFLLYS